MRFVSDRNLAAFDDEAIERKLAFEAPVDIARDVLVLNQRVRIERSHAASEAKVLHPDEHLAYPQACSRPVALAQTLDPAYHDIGSQSAIVVTEGRDGTVRGHQQRQDIEALGALVTNQPGTFSCDVLDFGINFGTLPGSTVHGDGALCIRSPLHTEKTWMRAGRNHSAAYVLDMHEPISFDAERSDHCPLHFLSGHRLDRISPDVRNRHCNLLAAGPRCVSTRATWTAASTLLEAVSFAMAVAGTCAARNSFAFPVWPAVMRLPIRPSIAGAQPGASRERPTYARRHRRLRSAGRGRRRIRRDSVRIGRGNERDQLATQNLGAW